VRSQAQAQADLIAATAADLLGKTHRRELTTLTRTAARPLRGRILIVNADGAVLVDSAGSAAAGTSYESRPELAAALHGRQIQVQRYSRTLGQQILATAVPIIRNGRPVGAVRVTQGIAAVDSAVRRAELGLVLIGLVVLALGLLAGGIIAAQVGRPIKRLEEVARDVAQGNLRARAELEGSREQQSLARSFNEMTERVTRLLNAQREFVADASHQLRTPLTGLRLRLEEARAHGGNAAAMTELGAALDEVDRLAHTVEELLVLSTAGERQMRGTVVDLSEVAAAALARWRPTATERAIGLTNRRSNGPSTAWGARTDIERALDCLLENALNYSPPGTTVEIATGGARVEVLDRGEGIAADEREAVFERFHRGRAGQTGPPGSGLGLSIARELARGSGGEVTIEERPGGGSVAILSLVHDAEHGGPPALPALNAEPSSLPTT
jgi:signal transduction histidine kinase